VVFYPVILVSEVKMRRFSLLNILLLTIASILFVLPLSCGDDDDDDSRGGVYVPPDDDTNDDVDDDVDDDADDDVNDDADDNFELTWITIPAGDFMMGCSPEDDMCKDHESPRHKVIITKDFVMTETEITQTQFEIARGFNPSVTRNCPDCPVENLALLEMEYYCFVVGGRTPTEAEWEYAARAGAETRYNCGNDNACLDDIAWFSQVEGDVDEPQPVGQKLPNAFGLYDVLGNVAERVSDQFDEDYYSTRPDPDTDPQGPDDGLIPSITRGGSYLNNNFEQVRLSNRAKIPPGQRTRSVGFRCVRDVDDDES
jgi:formylglycine-generating enzyme required for sulfatase activity